MLVWAGAAFVKDQIGAWLQQKRAERILGCLLPPPAQSLIINEPVMEENAVAVKTNIYSIFGQVEDVVAQAMVDEGKLTKIPYGEIPESVRRNEEGEDAKYAVIVPGPYSKEFEDRIKALTL